MKKLIISAIVVAAAGLGVYQTQAQKHAISDVALANAEALAEGEVVWNYDCCNICKGDFCGTFIPAGSSKAYDVFYKTGEEDL